MEFSTLVQSIGTKIDIAIAGMTVTPERQETVDFSEPYYDAVQYVLLPVDSEIKTYEDLEGKKIAVQLGTTGNFIAEEIEGAELATYDKATDACNDLVNGRADCMIIDKNPAEVFQGKFSDKLVAVDGAQFSFEVENYAIAMPKGDTELAEKINGALQELKEDGTFDQLVEEYITNYSAE
jgi:polar amino acid transport system substrate-binding protein